MNPQTINRQPPFRQIDLITESNFISYCKKMGISIDEKQLRFYEKEAILFPAVRVHRGFVEYKKVLIPVDNKMDWRYVQKDDVGKFDCKEIDLPIYYSLGGLSTGRKGCLDYYEKNKMVFYPSKEKYKEKIYPLSLNSFDTNTKRLGNPYLNLYNRYQTIIIKEIQSHLEITLMNESLFQDDKGWIKTGHRIKKFFQENIPFLQKRVSEYYEFLEFFNYLLDIRTKIYEKALNYYQESLLSGVTPSEAHKDTISNIQRQEQENIPRICKKAMNDLSLSVKGLTDWQELFVYKARWNDPMLSFYDYTEDIPQEIIDKTQGDIKFSQECYKIAENITWFLSMLGEKPQKVKYLATGRGYSICPYCNEAYTPKKKNSKTCGKEKCIKESKNHLKRLKRKMGIYD